MASRSKEIGRGKRTGSFIHLRQRPADCGRDNRGLRDYFGIHDEQDSYMVACVVSPAGRLSVYRRGRDGDGFCSRCAYDAQENRGVDSLALCEQYLHRPVLCQRREVCRRPLYILPRPRRQRPSCLDKRIAWQNHRKMHLTFLPQLLNNEAVTDFRVKFIKKAIDTSSLLTIMTISQQ